jgi:hypothetical protein
MLLYNFTAYLFCTEDLNHHHLRFMSWYLPFGSWLIALPVSIHDETAALPLTNQAVEMLVRVLCVCDGSEFSAQSDP